MAFQRCRIVLSSVIYLPFQNYDKSNLVFSEFQLQERNLHIIESHNFHFDSCATICVVILARKTERIILCVCVVYHLATGELKKKDE